MQASAIVESHTRLLHCCLHLCRLMRLCRLMTRGMTSEQVIARLGKEINNESSVCYWAARHGIPIFCPALTDGSLGDMLYFHSYKSPGLVIDVVGDIRAINDEAIKASPRKTGVIVLGGGKRSEASSFVAAILMLSAEGASASADHNAEHARTHCMNYLFLRVLWLCFRRHATLREVGSSIPSRCTLRALLQGEYVRRRA